MKCCSRQHFSRNVHSTRRLRQWHSCRWRIEGGKEKMYIGQCILREISPMRRGKPKEVTPAKTHIRSKEATFFSHPSFRAYVQQGTHHLNIYCTERRSGSFHRKISVFLPPLLIPERGASVGSCLLSFCSEYRGGH